MSQLSDDERDVRARAMRALEAELALPPALEARMLSAAFDEPGEHADADPSARAMAALDDDLAMPKEIEARLLAAAAAEVEQLPGPASARDADRPAASRSGTVKKGGGMRWMVFAAAAALAGVAIAQPWADRHSATSNHTPKGAVDAEAEGAADALAWRTDRPWAENMAALEVLRRYVVDQAGRETTRRIAARYVKGVRHALLDAGKAALIDGLQHVSSEHTFEGREQLKAYLVSGDARRLHEEGAWEAEHLTSACVDALRGVGGAMSSAELRAMVRPHVVAWIFLAETELAPPLAVDAALVERARAVLAKGSNGSTYDALVTRFDGERVDPRLPRAPANLVYPPVSLEGVLDGNAAWTAIVRSKNIDASGAAFSLAGAFTAKARRAILAGFDEANASLARDGWVVGDAAADSRAKEAIAAARERYDGDFQRAWSSFVHDVAIARPDAQRAPEVLRVLGHDDSPIARIVAALVANVRDDEHPDRVPRELRGVVAFAEASPPPMAAYAALLTGLADDIEKTGGDRARAGHLFEVAAARTRQLLAPFDDDTRALLAPLLLAPLEPPSSP